MRLVRVAASSVSVKVGAYADNLALLKEVVRTAQEREVSLLCLPEMCLTGYMLEDLVQWPQVTEAAWESLEELAAEVGETAVFAGLPVRAGGLLYNGLALLWKGSVRGVTLKRFLPSYSVFYEGRNFTPWRGGDVVRVRGLPAGDLLYRLPFADVAAQICEDAWVWPQENLSVLLQAEILCNASASPFSLFKPDLRRRVVQGAAERLICYHVFSNLVGLDSARLVFDGGAMVAGPEGVAASGPLLHPEPWRLVEAVVDLDEIARMRSENTTFREAYTAQRKDAVRGGVVDLRDTGEWAYLPPSEYPLPQEGSFFLRGGDGPSRGGVEAALDQLLDALVLGVRDYFLKAGVFRKFLVALSGGRDSALALLAAARAALLLPGEEDPEEKVAGRVEARYLSGPFSSPATLDAARGLCRELGVPFGVVSIEDEYRLAEKALREMAGGREPSPLALQNAQARIRGAMMLGWANTVGGLILVTSNLSEVAVGYFTTGGDNQGGFSPLADIPKTLISRMLERARERWSLESLDAVLAMAPSAELAPDQTDEKDLMPYEVLDDILYLYAWKKMRPREILGVLEVRHPAAGKDRLERWLGRFLALFDASQWKREQSPVALKLLYLDLDPKTGFRYPVLKGDLRKGGSPSRRGEG